MAAPRGRTFTWRLRGPPQRPGAASRFGFGGSSAAVAQRGGSGEAAVVPLLVVLGGTAPPAGGGTGGRGAVRRLQQKNSVHLDVSVAAGVPWKFLAHHPSNYCEQVFFFFYIVSHQRR